MSRQEAKHVLQKAFDRLGFKIPLVQFEPFYAGYHLFQDTEVVYGFGILDGQQRHLYDRQGLMVQVSLLLDKKAYVYDEEDKQWYVAKIYKSKKGKKLKVWHRFQPCDQPNHVNHSMYFYNPFHVPESTLDLIHQMTGYNPR